MKDQITITKDNYNLEEWKKAIIKKCREDNPSFTVVEMSKLLGITSRTIFRISKDYNLKLNSKEKKLILESWKK